MRLPPPLPGPKQWDHAIESRPDFIHRKPLLHAHLRRALEEVILSFRDPNTPITMVFGPSRVGKKSLSEQLISHVTKSAGDDRRYCPAAYAKVETFSGRTHWTSLYWNVQLALQVPTPSDNNMQARTNIASAIKFRRNRMIILDEAHNLKPSSKALDPRAAAAALKSLAQTIPTKLVLLGTYQLLDLASTTDEIESRTNDAHLERYHYDIEAEAEEFRLILEYVDREGAPWYGDVALAADPQFAHDGCIGCIGRLRNWLNSALGYNLDQGIPFLTREALEKKRTPQAKLDDLRRKAEEGEEKYRQFKARLSAAA